MYSATTRDIEVRVRPFYIEDRSDPSENRYVWGYQVTINNQSEEFVQLLSRYWHITDGTGRVEEVSGLALSATSRSSILATATSIRRGARFRRLPASWLAATQCVTPRARRSKSPSRPSRSICRS